MKTDIKGKPGIRMAAGTRPVFVAVLAGVTVLDFGTALAASAGEDMPAAGILAVLCMVGLILCTSRERGYRGGKKS